MTTDHEALVKRLDTTKLEALKPELLPCPFCGAEPVMEPEDPFREGDSWTRIRCGNDECPVAVEVAVQADNTHQAKAIAEWNSRPVTSAEPVAEDSWFATKPDELKPCPFCGCSNVIIRHFSDCHIVACSGCKAEGPITPGRDEAEAIDAWNTRATRPADDGLAGRLEELAAKATPGPWEWDAGIVPPDGPDRYAEIYVTDEDREPVTLMEFNDSLSSGRSDASLVVALRNNLPTIITALRAQSDAEVERIVAWLREDAASLNASEDPSDWKCAETVDECADALERGEHRKDGQ